MLENSTSTIALKEAIKRGYTINREGLVYNPSDKLIKGSKTKANYRNYSIQYNGSKYKLLGHQFQAYIKFGDEVFTAECVRHLDDNGLNNSWDNIELGSSKANTTDCYKNGNLYAITKHSNNRKKFTDDDVTVMLNMRSENKSYKFIADVYSANKSTIHYVLNTCACYKHLTHR